MFEDAFANGRGDVEAYEYIKANAREDFFKQRGDKVVLGLARGWKEARALEAGKKEKVGRMALVKAGMDARRCDFGPRLQDGLFIGFRGTDGWTFGYDLTSARDMEALQVGFLLARTCVSITRDKTVDEPCNDALDVIGRRWSDPEFRADTDLKTWENQESCMQYLRDNLKTPYDARGFKDTANAALNAHLRRTKQEAEEDARRREIERHNREIIEREGLRRDRDEAGDYDRGRGHGEPFMPPWARDPWK